MEPGLFNNREVASLIWLGVIAAGLLVRHRGATASACRDLMRAFRPVAVHFALYAIWIGAVTYVGARLGLWDRTLLKDTVLWTLLSGLGLLASTTDAMQRDDWFRRTMIASVGATAVLEFVANAKSFPLLVEVLLQPVVFFATVLPVVARDPEHRAIRSLAGWILALTGFVALGWTVLAAVDLWAVIDHRQLLREAVLPVWLTVGAVGFLYPFTLCMSYEQLLKQMRWRANGRPVLRQQLAVLVSVGPRLSVVRELQRAANRDVVDAEGFRAALQAIRHVRREQRADREAERAAAQRLINNAGVDGWDDDGKRLDQREFEETRKALHWLATCHMGHYRHDDRYRHDLLPIVEPHFVRDGLPEEHGIVMTVAGDGQLWYAYRKTASGWHFAIGAAGPPRISGATTVPSLRRAFPTMMAGLDLASETSPATGSDRVDQTDDNWTSFAHPRPAFSLVSTALRPGRLTSERSQVRHLPPPQTAADLRLHRSIPRPSS
ncbi:MAG TPA: hypothetical protein VK875_08270 [Euzebyales bacterium]|nr:hypothetical protein [Euzebyales bacterium]